jgi:ABC-type transport system involved in cytochrome c biogenesis permease subunit
MAGLLGIMYVFLGLFTPMLKKPLRSVSETGPSGIDEPRNPRQDGSAEIAYLTGPVVGTAIEAGRLINRASDRVKKRDADITVGAAIAKMAYAIICFATLFSFTGTVLGGIWADQSWGRFWGWDPKENGALIIVLWNAAILHARWGGMVRQRGLMNMAIFGNVVTSFSWFGVNMLEIGLHSYGFMDAAFIWLIGFVISQICIILLGLLPLRFWKSFSSTVPPSVPPQGPPRTALQPA